MSTLRHPEELHPLVCERVEECSSCDSGRTGRWYLCDYHEGWNDALAALEVEP